MKFYLSICLILFAVNSQAALNKWVDANGQVHYSDDPAPNDVKVKSISVPSVASGVPAQKSIAEQEMELKKKQKADEEMAQTATKKREKEQRQQNLCNQLHARLTTLENGGRISSYNDKGESIFLDDAELKMRAAETRKRISEECQQ